MVYSALGERPNDDAPAGSDTETAPILDGLARVRAATTRYLNGASDEQLRSPIAMPEEWHQYFGPSVEPEELIRWVARHEYYHLGQLIIYRWLLGDNPYQRG